MATTSSTSPTAIDRSSSRRGQSQSTPSRSQSTRTRAPATAPAHHRSSSSRPRGEEAAPPVEYEASNSAEAPRRSSSRDAPPSSRADQGRSGQGHQRSSSSRYSANMPSHAANSGGPAPVVIPSESKQKSSGKSRTTIPAQTGNWVLGKTIGAGSMGKVKLARRAEGGEQVCI